MQDAEIDMEKGDRQFFTLTGSLPSHTPALGTSQIKSLRNAGYRRCKVDLFVSGQLTNRQRHLNGVAETYVTMYNKQVAANAFQ